MSDATILIHPEAVMDAGMGQPEVERVLPFGERLWNSGALRKTLFLVLLGVIWEGYARYLDNPLLFPTLSETLQSGWENIGNGVLPARAWTSLRILLMGYAAGILLAAALTIVAIGTRVGTDILETMTAMFNPLPAIALLPLALIWFGLGTGSLVFVLIHSVLVGGGAEHPCRVPGGVADAADGGAQLRAAGAALRVADPDPGGVPEHPDGTEGRLGVCLADADRGGAGVWRFV